MANNPVARLSIVIDHNQSAAFFPLLQQGFRVDVVVGQSIHKILCHQLNINADYIEERIKTVFLDGKPVDDVHSTILREGATLSLSAAMPGLVGATFRKGGLLASFRSSITHQEESGTSNQRKGYITLKLFNLLVKELGPILLEHGIRIQTKDWEDLVQRQPETFWAECKRIRVNGQDTNPQALASLVFPDSPQLVLLEVTTAD